jgi:hypothetical protein
MKIERRVPTLRIIADLVIENTGIDIRKKGRKAEAIKAKWIYAKLARTHTTYPSAMVGAEIGKDHATVLRYYKRIDNFTFFTKELEAEFSLYSKELLSTNSNLINIDVVETFNRNDYAKLFTEFRKAIKKLKKTIIELRSRKNTANNLAKAFRIRYEQEIAKNNKLNVKLIKLQNQYYASRNK